MQLEMAKKLYQAFDCAISEMLPMFAQRSAGSKACVRLYQWKPSEVSVFLLLVLSPNSDAFTWEGAWSVKQEFPFHLYPMSPVGKPNADIPAEEPVEGEFRFRIPELWDVGKDTWWHLRGDFDKRDIILDEFANIDWAAPTPTYSDQQIRSVVDAAVSRIKSDALPFLSAAISRSPDAEIP